MNSLCGETRQLIESVISSNYDVSGNQPNAGDVANQIIQALGLNEELAITKERGYNDWSPRGPLRTILPRTDPEYLEAALFVYGLNSGFEYRLVGPWLSLDTGINQ